MPSSATLNKLQPQDLPEKVNELKEQIHVIRAHKKTGRQLYHAYYKINDQVADILNANLNDPTYPLMKELANVDVKDIFPGFPTNMKN